jgi:hypothetical protein
VPGDVHVAVAVGADRAAAVEPDRRLDEIPLGLKCGTVIIEPRVEHRRRIARCSRGRFARAHPGDVDASALTDRQMGAANVAHCNRTARFAVDPDRLGELGPVPRANVIEITARRVSAEVDQMDGALPIDGGLGLDASFRHT